MVQMRSASVVNFALLTTLTAVGAPWVAANAFPSFPQSGTIAPGTNVRIKGSSNLGPLNQSLKKGFEQQYAGAKATVSNLSTAAALDAVVAGNADIAAIGRPLTDAEKAKGLVAVPMGRDKIAIVVGAKNAYKKDLTINQFAKLFRGEAKSWKDIGGANTPVRFVDRVNTDTRAAFPNYPAFQGKQFASGTTAVKVEDENPAAMSAKLGSDGISFLPASLVAGQKDIHVLSMHGVQPTDQRYPFSQELFYVYQGDKPNPAVQAFLGYAGATAGQGAIAQAVKNPIDFNKQAEAGKVAQVAAKAGDPAKAKPDIAAEAKAKAAAEAKVKADAAAKAKPESAKPADKTPVSTANVPKAAAETRVEPAQPGAVASNQIAIGDETGRGIPPWLWWLLLPLGLLGLLLWLLPKDEEEDVLPRANSSFGAAVPNPVRGASTAVGGAVDTVTGTASKVAGAVGGTANAGGAAVAGAGVAIAGAGAAAMARLRGDRAAIDDTRRSDSEWEPGTGDSPAELGIETPDWNLNVDESTEVVADDPSWLQAAQGKAADLADATQDGLGNAFDSGSATVAGAGAAAAGLGAAAWSRLRGNDASDTNTTNDVAADWEFEGGLPPANADPSARIADFAADTNQSGSGLLGRAKDMFGNAVDQTRDTAGNLVDGTKDRAASGTDTVTGAVSNVTGTVTGGVSTLTDTAGDAAATTSGWLKSLFGKAKDVAGDATDAAADVGGQLKDGVTGAAGATMAGLGAAGAAIGATIPGAGRVVMVPYNSREALVRWEMSANAQAKLRQQGGNQLVLRLYDVTDMDSTETLLSTFEQFDVDEASQEQRILIPQRDRTYLTVLGYLTRSGGFLEVSRSESVQIPAI
jgi:phosphate transport system substrate-binding protein